MFSAFLAQLASRRGWRAAVTALGLGVMAALALPPVHAVPLLWVAIPGLLAMVDAAPGWRRAAWLGFFWGWGHHAAGLYWITHAILTEVDQYWWLVPIAVPAMAIPLAAFVAVPVALARLAPAGWPRLLVLAGAWTLSEIARGFAFTGFPWNLTGTVWAFDALPVQGAAWIGLHGLSLLTLLLAGLPAVLPPRRALGLGAAGLAAMGLFGVLRLWPEEPAPQPVVLVLVQGNVAQETKWRAETRLPIFQRYLELTRRGLARAAAEAPPNSTLVAIWPESASPFLLAQDGDVQRAAAEALPEGATLIAGTVRAEWGPDGRASRVWNSLVAIGSDGRPEALYDKAHLVPFGEYMPLRGLLPIRLVHGGMDFSAGPGPVLLEAPGVPPFGALICYEVIFPAAVTPEPRPDWLVNLTNDAWFGISAGPYQHLAAARLRAVEEGLPLARAAQTGISAVFDARGREVASLGLGLTGTVAAPLPAPREPTPFARLGLWSPGVIAAFFLASGWWLGRRRRVKRPVAATT